MGKNSNNKNLQFFHQRPPSSLAFAKLYAKFMQNTRILSLGHGPGVQMFTSWISPSKLKKKIYVKIPCIRNN